MVAVLGRDISGCRIGGMPNFGAKVVRKEQVCGSGEVMFVLSRCGPGMKTVEAGRSE